jgi:hypothetical protein
MKAFQHRVACAIVAVFCLLSAQHARAELIATTGDVKLAGLAPLRNGVSAITLVWPVDPPTPGRAAALTAGLSSVVSGGTSSRSPYEIETFLRLKGIRQDIRIHGRNLLLTVSAPDDVFPETLVHLENLLLESEYSSGWYAREFQRNALKNASRTGRSSDVLSEVIYFLAYQSGDKAEAGNPGEFRFGGPAQVILRSGNKEVERRTVQLLRKLPKPTWQLSVSKWAASLIRAVEPQFTLPSGIVHFADPDSSEMLVLLVKAEEFKDEGDQLGANLLLDYIGGNQGSEMFRIIRQEMRAAYDPHADFVVTNKNRAVLSLSATVEAEKWPEIHARIRQIYEDTRNGNIDRSGLKIQYDHLKGTYFSNFFNNPGWGERHYLNEYPEGVKGAIRLPILEELDRLSIDEIAANPKAHLPPLEEFLLILIGGGRAPTDAQKAEGYCALPKNTPLGYCLDILSSPLD